MSANSSGSFLKRIEPTLQKVSRATVTTTWVLFGFVLTQFSVIFILQVLISAGLVVEQYNQTVLNVAIAAAVYALSLAIVVGWPKLLKLWSARISMRRLLGLHERPKLKHIGVAMLGYFVYLGFVIIVATVITSLVPAFNPDEQQVTGFDSGMLPFELLLAFMALVILAPVAEELLFRGYMFGTLRRSISFIPATVITSILFGFVHFQWNVGVDVFVLSLVLCYLRERYHSIWPSIYLHMLKNGVAFYLLFIAKII